MADVNTNNTEMEAAQLNDLLRVRREKLAELQAEGRIPLL